MASTAEGPEAMALGTANGPIRLGPFSRVIWAASRMTRVEGPPSPTIRPMRGSLISSGVRPEEASASSKAMWAQAVPAARKRAARRSTFSVQSPMAGGACTWQRKPSSAYSGAATTPERAWRRLSVTSRALPPMEETMPSPVTTTRRMQMNLPCVVCRWAIWHRPSSDCQVPAASAGFSPGRNRPTRMSVAE